MRKKVIAVDFDGVLHSYVSGWKGAHVIPDPPVPGAFEFLAKICNDFNLDVVIFSSRAKTWRGRRAIRSWLYQEAPDHWHEDAFFSGFSNIKVTAKKPAASIYIDDRGYRFEGTFPEVKDILEMKPWNK